MKVKGIFGWKIYGVDCTLVVAPTSPFKYKDKEIKKLKKLVTLDLTVKQICDSIEVIGNKLVVFGGFEWGDSPKELMAIVSALAPQKLNIVFQTGYTVDEFQEIIGRNCYDMIELTKENEHALLSEDDPEVYQLIGLTILEYISGSTHIINEVTHSKREVEATYLFEGGKDEECKN